MLDELANCPLCLGWDTHALHSIGRIVTLREWRAGETVFKQGDHPTGALVLVEGEGEVVRLLPGGGELALATLRAGDIVGELGLISTLPRSATFRARSDLHTLLLDRTRYQGALNLYEPAALKLARNILQRIASLTRNARHQLGGHSSSVPPAVTQPALAPASFNYEPFLSLLPAFRPFLALDWASLRMKMRAFTLPPATIVNSLGASARGLTFVVRGALEAQHPGDFSSSPLQVFGPGAICGLVNALDEQGELLSIAAREESLVLHLEQEDFKTILAGDDALGAAMIDSISHALADNFMRLTSRISQITGIQRAHDIAASVESN